MDYLDFEVELRKSLGVEYSVNVLFSPAGEGREVFHLPFTKSEIYKLLDEIQATILRSGSIVRKIHSGRQKLVQDFGQALFNALFVGEIRSLYDRSFYQAAHESKGLRLKLRVEPPEMICLPWEFLFDSRQDEFICLSENTPIVRYIELPQAIKPLTITPPLRILGMAVSPKGVPSLQVEREKNLLEEATKHLRTLGLIELKWINGRNWRDLQRTIRAGTWHIFHFIGHGGFDQHNEEGFIVLSNQQGTARKLSATELARLLSGHHSLRLVVLNSCEGARSSQTDNFSSLASILVRRGIPAVLAMQFEITDNAAIELGRSFYEALSDRVPVDTALAEARKAISLSNSDSLEWGTPVMYLRSPDGVIFNIQDAKSQVNIEEAVKVAVHSSDIQTPSLGSAHSHQVDTSGNTNIGSSIQDQNRIGWKEALKSVAFPVWNLFKEDTNKVKTWMFQWSMSLVIGLALAGQRFGIVFTILITIWMIMLGLLKLNRNVFSVSSVSALVGFAIGGGSSYFADVDADLGYLFGACFGAYFGGFSVYQRTRSYYLNTLSLTQTLITTLLLVTIFTLIGLYCNVTDGRFFENLLNIGFGPYILCFVSTIITSELARDVY